jgi:hypothetical protein
MGHRIGIAPVEDRTLRATRSNKGWRRSLRVAIGFFFALGGAIAALYFLA